MALLDSYDSSLGITLALRVVTTSFSVSIFHSASTVDRFSIGGRMAMLFIDLSKQLRLDCNNPRKEFMSVRLWT